MAATTLCWQNDGAEILSRSSIHIILLHWSLPGCLNGVQLVLFETKFFQDHFLGTFGRLTL